MTAPKIQIGKLEFEDIKQSLVDFLKQQSIISDYSYDGSAVRVLIDILAYNTMYQAYYMNMIANESFLDTAQRIQSIISLVKPLGYVVPGKTSAVASVLLRSGGDGNTVPRYTQFRGKNANGVGFNFYTNQQHILDEQGEGFVEILEGSSFAKELPVTVDVESQKAFISNVNIDLKTLKVEVKRQSNEEAPQWVEWSFSSNINQNINDQSLVYFLERSELGYFIVFGGRSATGTTDQSGLRIESGDSVRVSYIISSGAAGNLVSHFNITAQLPDEITPTVETVRISAAGTDEPDIENIKFFAPKWFSAQDRAVTADDCKAILAQYSGLDKNAFSVWGGEEMDPPFYGRVFVSLLSGLGQSQSDDAAKAISILRDKCVISILPEYLPPEIIVGRFYGTATYNGTTTNESSLKANMLNLLNSSHGSPGFDRRLTINDVISTINKSNPGIVAQPSDLQIELSITFDATQNSREFNFRQPIQTIKINNIDSGLSSNKMYIESYGTADSAGLKKIRAYYLSALNSTKIVINANVGNLNTVSGKVKLNPKVVIGEGKILATPIHPVAEAMQNAHITYNFSGIGLKQQGIL